MLVLQLEHSKCYKCILQMEHDNKKYGFYHMHNGFKNVIHLSLWTYLSIDTQTFLFISVYIYLFSYLYIYIYILFVYYKHQTSKPIECCF